MKIGIFILVHHNPWLIKNSIKSLNDQTISKKYYDLNFILIKGNGKINSKEYDKYNKLTKSTGDKNFFLTDFNKSCLKHINKIKNKKIIIVKNDHGLDSGAWLKIIKNNKYSKYDFSIFLMEGFLFTNRNVLANLLEFIQKYNPDFISSGHEKRFLSKKTIQNIQTINKSLKMQKYRKKIFFKIFKLFSKTKLFNKIFKKWPDNFNGNDIITENHIPKYYFSFFTHLKIHLKTILTGKISFFQKRNVFVTTLNSKKFLDLYDISDHVVKIKNTYFHKEKSPYFYGCSCQHIFSKKLLNEFNKYLKKNKLYKILKYPFMADSFEIIWGLIPSAFKKDKWFFDGIYRPRKNFYNYKRNDDKKNLEKFYKFFK